MNNRLFLTFTTQQGVEDLIEEIVSNYTIKYNKIFIFNITTNGEFACTYNTELPNINKILPNTILVHRKKESNTLYTINALNELIKSLNNGVVDTTFPIKWQHYKNTILLTQHNELKQLKTKIFKIVNL